MPCYKPRPAFLNVDGGVVWNAGRSGGAAVNLREIQISCGECLGCYKAVARDWSLRVYHEVSTRLIDWKDEDTGVTTKLPNACVVTLTYDEEHIPLSRALSHRDFQLFMKRLRRWHDRRWRRLGKPGKPPGLSYFMCGEYGPKTYRPHFHAVLMGVCFDDTYEIMVNGKVQRCSYALDKLWSQPPTLEPFAPSSRIGVATVDGFSFAGAAYVAGYVAKKDSDRLPGPTWEKLDPVTGEVTTQSIQAEYRKMSKGRDPVYGGRARGIGHDWLYKSWTNNRFSEVYSRDCVTLGEWTFRPPRYYDKLLREYRIDLLGDVLRGREAGQFEAVKEWTEERCTAAEKVAVAALRGQRDSL